jgi:hypothetical protein
MIVKRGFILLSRIWPLIVIGLLFAVFKRYENAYLFPAFDRVIDYEIFSNSPLVITALSCLILPITIIVVFIAYSWKTSQRTIVGVTSVFLLIVLNMAACVSTFGLVFGNFHHFDTAGLGNHIYHVYGIWKVGVGHNSRALFSMFECDSSGTQCQIVHQQFTHPTEEEFKATVAEVAPDVETQTVSFIINGQVIYTHHPQN